MIVMRRRLAPAARIGSVKTAIKWLFGMAARMPRRNTKMRSPAIMVRQHHICCPPVKRSAIPQGVSMNGKT
jgi:hypothetical protein